MLGDYFYEKKKKRKVQERANLTPRLVVYLKPVSISLNYSDCLLADLGISICPPPPPPHPVFNPHSCLKDLIQKSDHGASLLNTKVSSLSSKQNLNSLAAYKVLHNLVLDFASSFLCPCSLHMPRLKPKLTICHFSVIIPFWFTCPHSVHAVSLPSISSTSLPNCLIKCAETQA